MNKALRVGFAAIAVLGAAQSHAASVDIKGSWEIDMAPMLEQAKKNNAPAEQVAQLERRFQGSQMVIDAKTITLSLADSAAKPMTYQYKLAKPAKTAPNKANCVSLSIDALPAPLDYCINDGALSVIDPTSVLVSVYRRKPAMN
ncbi:hypothetical protein LXA47_08810 [Massilia sp. P8910]|uniref:hypothetical protein n=1 Tax=Massilia antarctica TaxID=2765360 RepID=UPI0006BB5FD8|nr:MULTISPECIES: hypothetical protein [Massilia]MCE3603706.1 hypothetical protein [Massilia antarctica]MCY0912860.1 hypothetical protein [Massilia sp. H27-R4]CUI07434.1 hypothetical protein BN2497_9645 [Janthinobacterium sp. CG23_2]CUU31220.1 hypothetical protein BN3177_9645 [Janthinobacterium sp. CG23_2]